MATFQTTGLDSLILSMEELARLPEDVMQDILSAGGEVIRAAQIKKIEALNLMDSHQLMESITVNKKVKFNSRGGGSRYITVYPKGTRRRKGTEGTSPVTNNDVAFVHEFGASDRQIEATQWMRRANEESASAAVDAEERVYHQWLKKLDL